MKVLTLGCVNMMNGKRLVTEKIQRKKGKEKENGNRTCSEWSPIRSVIITITKLSNLIGSQLP